MQRRLFLAVLGLTTLTIAGCGGGDDETSVAAAPLPKGQFLKKGKEICSRSLESQRDAFESANAEAEAGNVTPQEVQDNVAKSIFSSLEQMIAELSSLGPPEGDEDQVAHILDLYRRNLREVEAAPDKYFKTRGFEEAERAADKYGLTCRV